MCTCVSNTHSGAATAPHSREFVVQLLLWGDQNPGERGNGRTGERGPALTLISNPTSSGPSDRRTAEPSARPPIRPSASPLIARLTALGLPAFHRIETHRNQQVMVSWVPEQWLRVHEGYAEAPDSVLAAIVRCVRPGSKRATRLAARQIFLAFPAEEHAPSQTRPAQPRTPSPRDAEVVAELVRLHGELNHRHFEGRLSRIPIELSGRMRSRLGELRLERRTGQAAAIGISRRHLKRDGWSGVRETLLHEMVHQWQAESGLPVDHRGEFRRKAREVGIVARAVRVD